MFVICVLLWWCRWLLAISAIMPCHFLLWLLSVRWSLRCSRRWSWDLECDWQWCWQLHLSSRSWRIWKLRWTIYFCCCKQYVILALDHLYSAFSVNWSCCTARSIRHRPMFSWTYKVFALSSKGIDHQPSKILHGWAMRLMGSPKNYRPCIFDTSVVQGNI